MKKFLSALLIALLAFPASAATTTAANSPFNVNGAVITPTSVSTGAVTSSVLTSGRCTFATTGGLLTDSAAALCSSGGFNGVLGATTPAAITGTTITATTSSTTPTANVSSDLNITGSGVTYGATIGGNISGGVDLKSTGRLAFTAGSSALAAVDTVVTRSAAKQLMISGDGVGATTNAGIILGYRGISGDGAIWASTAAPTSGNFTLVANSNSTYLNAPNGNISFYSGGAEEKFTMYMSTAGRGAGIQAGTAGSAVNALSITQTRNFNSSATDYIKASFTITSAHASDTLLNLYAGASGTTSVFSVGTTGILSLPGTASDAATTNNSACITTTTGAVTKGSGTLGICLGTSSERYKTKIEPLEEGLPEILALVPIKFYLDAEHGNPDKLQYGFSAEKSGVVLPALLGKDNGGIPNTFDYLGLVPVLVNAVQQQQAQINELRAR